eukprot:1263606-Prymnesium_polylepis.1
MADARVVAPAAGEVVATVVVVTVAVGRAADTSAEAATVAVGGVAVVTVPATGAGLAVVPTAVVAMAGAPEASQVLGLTAHEWRLEEVVGATVVAR